MQNLINLTGAGLNVATFTEIRAALIDEYKNIYGSDIDLSTGSADGVYVNNQALIINNLLNVIQVLYNNLDVNTANGVYLDTLCALANVTRKPATPSNASLQVENLSSSSIIISDATFVDQGGTTWKYVGSDTITLAGNETKQITVTCDELGPVAAPAGWINNTIENLPVAITQENAANLGTDIESDTSLRARRNQSSGASGVTVLNSLSGALLNISGIDDVYIYNNNTSSNITAKDTTTVDTHSIYVVIRQREGVEIDDSVIGSIIHEKLTPGIHSCDSNCANTNGTHKSYEYPIVVLGQTISDAEQNIYWKKAIGVHPNITITITPLNYFTTDEINNIGATINDYLNKLPLSTDLTTNELIIEAVYADPLFKSRPTYNVKAVNITTATNPDTYYNYTNVSYTTSGDDIVITLS